MKLTTEQLKRIIKEEINKLLFEALEPPEDLKELDDLIYDSEPEDLIYYGIDNLNKMKAAFIEEIIDHEEKYESWMAHDPEWAEDNIVPLQQAVDKIEKAIEIAVDMGFGEITKVEVDPLDKTSSNQLQLPFPTKVSVGSGD